jgi:hypothetical protein
MSGQSLQQRLTESVLEIFDETFNQVHGIYLDGGTSLFETLETITPEMASIPVSATCASLAAQVAHVNFYLNVLEGHMLNKPLANVDWGEIWRTVREVTPEEWAASKEHLKASKERVLLLINGFSWEGEHDIEVALAVIVHTAYHLGEIRQALCTLREMK